jgi:hypothetical protein
VHLSIAGWERQEADMIATPGAGGLHLTCPLRYCDSSRKLVLATAEYRPSRPELGSELLEIEGSFDGLMLTTLSHGTAALKENPGGQTFAAGVETLKRYRGGGEQTMPRSEIVRRGLIRGEIPLYGTAGMERYQFSRKPARI